MKRYIAFLLVFILVLTLPLSVFALPENDVDDTYVYLKSIYITTNRGDAALYYEDHFYFDFGHLYRFTFEAAQKQPYEVDLRIQYTVEFNFPSSTDLYYVRTLDSFSTDGTIQLLSIMDTSSQSYLEFQPSLIDFQVLGDYNHFPFIYNTSTHDVSLGNFTNALYSGNVKFNVINSIPPGRYLFTFQTGEPFASSIGNFAFPFGFYADNRTTGSNAPDLTGNPITDYELGYISFDQATSLIRSNMQDVLTDPNSTDFEKQLVVSIAGNQLSQLQNVSNEKFSSTVDNFQSASQSIVQDYYDNPTTDIIPVIDSLTDIYTDTITQATTPEQGMLINAQYSVKLAQLQAGFQVAYKGELDDVLSDQDMQNKQDSYDKTDSSLAVEEEVLDIFSEYDYQSQLAFDNWLNQFSQYGDITAYRRIFEFFFEDPSTVKLQPFLTVPFSLVLVGVILATTTVVFKRRQ